MYNRVYDFLTKNKILYEKQFGFQSSTYNFLIEFHNFLMKSNLH